MGEKAKLRLTYIDWMRGLACLLMFQTHCYDSWLGGRARGSQFFRWSQLGGTLPAPLFLFLAGISLSLTTEKLRSRGVSRNEIFSSAARRGAEIYGLGILFRVQEFVLGQPGAPWSDLLRVDILNIIGISIVLMAGACWAGRTRVRTIVVAAAGALSISLLTPLVWTVWRPRGLPWYLESYVNGVHIYNQPQPWLFPIFPWTGFAFAGLAAGFLLLSGWSRARQTLAMAAAGASGVGMYYMALWLDARPRQVYPDYDFWHTSPNFFLARVGVLLAIVFVSYAWCQWGPAEWGFSPLRQLGQTSLLVYWVHIEFVYGRFSILTKRSQSVASASAGLLTIFVAMVLLSLARTRWKGRGAEVLAALSRAVRPPAPAQRASQ